jgi:phosphatidate phosphatase PAH1
MPLVGKDWTQSGVARLFSAIKVSIFFNNLTYSFILSRIFKANYTIMSMETDLYRIFP